MSKVSFRPSEIEGEVLEKIGSERSNSALKIARPIISQFIDFSDDRQFSLNKPVELRNEIFEFYIDNPRDYSEITTQHVMPIKKMIEFLEEKVEDEEQIWNAWMIKNTIKPSYFGEEIASSHQVDRLDDKILNKDKLSILRGKVTGKDRFIVELFLETTAKIGVVAALRHENFPSSSSDASIVNLRKQYIEQEGIKELPDHRSRPVPITQELVTMYFRNYGTDQEGYLFGDNPKKAHSHLRSRFRQIRKELEFSVNQNILRDTGAYLKLDEKDVESIRKIMGLKTTSRIQRYKAVKEKRREHN